MTDKFVPQRSSEHLFLRVSLTLPGLTWLGCTPLAPEGTVSELNGGVTHAWQLRHSKQVAESELVLKLIQLQLEETGVRPLDERGFYNCEPNVIVDALEVVCARISAQDTAEDVQRLLQHAESHLSSATPSNKELNQAQYAYLCAFELGEATAGYFAAQVVCQLMARKAGDSLQESLLLNRAEQLYAQCGEQGVARAWADLALLQRSQGNLQGSHGSWFRYFDSFTEQTPPPDELQYLADLLHTHYFSKSEPVTNLGFLKGHKVVVSAVHARTPKDPEFLAWAKEHCWSTRDFLLEKLQLPVLTLVGMALMWWSNPEVAAGLGVGAVAYFFLVKKKQKK